MIEPEDKMTLMLSNQFFPRPLPSLLFAPFENRRLLQRLCVIGGVTLRCLIELFNDDH
jgi:hypothetical protein